ncbi:hypothetical protein SG34_010620 [Thalassomonas viridans]|uniref:Glycine-rich domain-containing protein n=1 Tax=Thalassomonas viridans TaxID=137584 RepID=A0AAE9Z713_9GAMM|nr:hypothetical protein [Thalassomonas viridans]WDE07299.1 hypothetical protein SG34_010620 [Thalassomonas viridans]
MNVSMRSLPLAKGNLVLVTEIITESGFWQRPENLIGDAVYLDMIGGGGGGGAAVANGGNDTDGGNGGNSGSFVIDYFVDISSVAVAENVAVTIGDGGDGALKIDAGNATARHNGQSGAPTSFGSFVSVSGGAYGRADYTNLTAGGFVGGHGSAADTFPVVASRGAGPFGGSPSYTAGGGASGLFSTDYITSDIYYDTNIQDSAKAGKGYGAGGYGMSMAERPGGKGAKGVMIIKYFVEAE